MLCPDDLADLPSSTALIKVSALQTCLSKILPPDSTTKLEPACTTLGCGLIHGRLEIEVGLRVTICYRVIRESTHEDSLPLHRVRYVIRRRQEDDEVVWGRRETGNDGKCFQASHALLLSRQTILFLLYICLPVLSFHVRL